jgi:hypothetical protein
MIDGAGVLELIFWFLFINPVAFGRFFEVLTGFACHCISKIAEKFKMEGFEFLVFSPVAFGSKKKDKNFPVCENVV